VRSALNRWTSLVLVASSAATVTISSPAAAKPAPAASTGVVQRHLRAAIRDLPVAAHSHAASYDRAAAYGEWISQGDGCDTRAVVLKTESKVPTTQNRYCTIKTGRWYSFYDARYYTNAYGGAVQIDHVVPTENVWISGAWRWTHATRVRFYNDLGDPRTLVAVDQHDNEAKGDQDPGHWMPSHGKCRYVRYWVAVKTRWQLTVTAAEKAALQHIANVCTNPLVTVRLAPVDIRH
jgi:hypothetical protein